MKSFTYDTIIVVHSEICTDRKMLKDLFHLFKKKKKTKKERKIYTQSWN